MRVVVSVSADAVDAEHEERADDGRDAGGEERGRVPPRAVVDPAWREGEGINLLTDQGSVRSATAMRNMKGCGYFGK